MTRGISCWGHCWHVHMKAKYAMGCPLAIATHASQHQSMPHCSSDPWINHAASMPHAACKPSMITPHFELSQDEAFVHVRIRLPHLRAKEDGEFYVLDNEFKFFLRPYFLRLTFRQQLVEDGRERAEHMRRERHRRRDL